MQQSSWSTGAPVISTTPDVESDAGSFIALLPCLLLNLEENAHSIHWLALTWIRVCVHSCTCHTFVLNASTDRVNTRVTPPVLIYYANQLFVIMYSPAQCCLVSTYNPVRRISCCKIYLHLYSLGPSTFNFVVYEYIEHYTFLLRGLRDRRD